MTSPSSQSRCSSARRLVVVAAVLLCCILSSAASVASAKDCVTREGGTMMAWKHDKGSFQCVNCLGAAADAVKSGAVRRQWHEYDHERKLVNAFVEEMREGMQLVLRDEGRDISILLRSDLSGIRTGGEQNFRQLYGGTFMMVVDCT